MGTDLHTTITFARDVEAALREQRVVMRELCTVWQVPEPKTAQPPVVVDLAQLATLNKKGRGQQDHAVRDDGVADGDDDSVLSPDPEPADDGILGDKRYQVADPDHG